MLDTLCSLRLRNVAFLHRLSSFPLTTIESFLSLWDHTTKGLESDRIYFTQCRLSKNLYDHQKTHLPNLESVASGYVLR